MDRGVGSHVATRVLGVIAAAVLGVGTFSALGLMLLDSLYERGAVGHRGFGDTNGLTYLAIGLIGGAIVGVVVAMWVGLRVWQARWTLLALLGGFSCITAVVLVVASSR